MFEFLGLPEDKPVMESDLEKALVEQIEKFLLELGRGFMFVGHATACNLFKSPLLCGYGFLQQNPAFICANRAENHETYAGSCWTTQYVFELLCKRVNDEVIIRPSVSFSAQIKEILMCSMLLAVCPTDIRFKYVLICPTKSS